MSGAESINEGPTAGTVTRDSSGSVADTVERFSTLLAAKGLKIFAVIDQAAEAASVGLELRETRLIMFGNPRAGTPVMVAAPLSALDLPLKVVVWDDNGQTKISYTDPDELAARYQLPAELAELLAGIRALVNAVAE
jgi:uncharacterized protein (DUF302 family)